VEISEVFDKAAAFFSLAAVLAFFLLLVLYFSQRRDIKRLSAWSEREPDHPATDLAASEQLLDRAEAELEELLGEPEAQTQATPAEAVPAATRVTHERPALERITMERAALEPHPRWRRFVSRATQPRVLIAIGVSALLLGAATIYVTEELLKDDDGPRRERQAAVAKSEITVSVLNGTSINGLAGKVGSDLEGAGYDLGQVTTTESGVAETIVMYADGQKRAAQKVAKQLGVTEITPVDRPSERLGGEADVFVVAGEDRAS
jgi:hypothetical protein